MSTPTTPIAKSPANDAKVSPTTPSGKALDKWLNSTTRGEPYSREALQTRIVAIEREAFLAGLDSPEVLELLAGALMNTIGRNGWVRCTPPDPALEWLENARLVLASMRSSLRAETDKEIVK